MKILFLDIDGVLNSETYAVRYMKENLQNKGNHIWVDPDAVNMIKQLCEETGCKIIISSSWRSYDLEHTKTDLSEYRDLKPLVPYIVGTTPRSISRFRGREIDAVLNNKIECERKGLINSEYIKEDIESYAIVDDDNDMMDYQMDHFVQTNDLFGLQKQDIEKLKNILNGEQNGH